MVGWLSPWRRPGRTYSFVAGWGVYAGVLLCRRLECVGRHTRLPCHVPELVMRGALYEVAGWTIYQSEVAICSLVIIVFAWLNRKDAALPGQFQFFAVVLMFGTRVTGIAFVSWVYVGVCCHPAAGGWVQTSPAQGFWALAVANHCSSGYLLGADAGDVDCHGHRPQRLRGRESATGSTL